MVKKKFRSIVTTLAIGTTLWVCQASATPPERPVEIRPAAAKEVPLIEAVDKVFIIPVDIRVSDGVGGVRIQTEIMSTAPLVPKSVARDEQRFKEAPGRVWINIPVIEEQGIYKVEIAGGDLEGGVYSRIMLYQVVDKSGTRLYTQQQWREQRTRMREKAFRDSQSVRDFAGRMRQVKKEALEGVRVEPGKTDVLLVRADPAPGRDAEYVQDHSGDAWRERDPITVRGRIVYTDFEGTVRPLVNAGVYLYDDDTFGDEFLGSTATNGNGEYSFSVNNDDGWLQNGRDVYVKLKLRNTRWRVRDSGDYEWSSDVRDDRSDGAVVDYGTLTPDDDQEAAQVFAFINRAWSHVVTVGGRDPGFVEVDYPSSGDFFDGVLNIAAASNRAPDIVIHEYGHFLMEAAYPGGDPSPGGAHNFGSATQDARLSWSEGWATGFMLSQCNDGEYNWDEGTSENAGEWPACTTQDDTGGRAIELYSNSTNRIGEQQEGRVAAALLDFIDAADDDNGGTENRGRNDRSDNNAANRVSLATLYNSVMWGSGHDNMIEFWRSLAGELSGDTLAGASRIMQYNWMSEPVSIEIDCVASKIATAELRDPAVTLDGLRAFRDEALKPLADGRRMIRIYYRHSPELAMLLIGDAASRKDATQVVQYFARLGEAARNHQLLKKLAREDGPILPASIVKASDRIFALIQRNGSQELQRDALRAQKELRALAKLTWSQALRAGAERERVKIDDASTAIRQHDLAPASQKADWALIRKQLPARERALEGGK